MLEKHGLPVANMGMVAGLGTKLLTRWALSEAEPGDTLIVALEPRLLTEPLTHTSAAVQFSYLLRAPQWLRKLDGSAGLALPSQLLMLRPGGYHVFTLLAKGCAGAPLYRYQARDVHASGWLQTPLRLSFDSPPLHGPHLSAEAVQLLRRLSEYCAARHIRLAYSLPWRFTPPDQVEMFQQQNITFLLQVAAFFPVLKDPELGAHSVREHFADTAWHLTGEGSAARTDSLARQIQRWEVWSLAELRSRPASPEPRPPQR
ncbi:MAG: hypothetical protein NTW03_02565 [Verrucomicrobia bacterium]|nr:hypothetical protein [Verrucomicrobiota bacterium]